MNIETDLNSQINVASWINQKFAIPFSLQNDNERLSHACFDMVIEHHISILTLCKEELYGSAIALLRVEFEALVRGLWLRHVATQTEITNFKSDKINPEFHELIKAVKEHAGINEGLFSCIKEKQWNIFNSFTHMGKDAVSRRVEEIATGYDSGKETDVIKALRFSGLIAVLTAVELASLSRNQDIMDNTLDFAKTFAK